MYMAEVLGPPHSHMTAKTTPRSLRPDEIPIANVGLVTAMDERGRLLFLPSTELADGRGSMVHYLPPSVTLVFLFRPIANGVIEQENNEAHRQAQRKEREEKRRQEEEEADERDGSATGRRNEWRSKRRYDDGGGNWQPREPQTTPQKLAECILTQMLDGLVAANVLPSLKDDAVEGYGLSPIMDSVLATNYARPAPRTQWQRTNASKPVACTDSARAHRLFYTNYALEVALADATGRAASTFVTMDEVTKATATLPYAKRVADGGLASSISIPEQVYRLTVMGLSPYAAIHMLCSPIVCNGSALDQRIRTAVIAHGQRIAVVGNHVPVETEWPTRWGEVYGQLKPVRDDCWRPWQVVASLENSKIPDHVWRGLYRYRLALHGARESFGWKSCTELLREELLDGGGTVPDPMDMDEEATTTTVKAYVTESADRIWRGADGVVVETPVTVAPASRGSANAAAKLPFSETMATALQFAPPLPWDELLRHGKQLVKDGLCDPYAASRALLEWVVRATSSFTAAGGSGFCRTVRLGDATAATSHKSPSTQWIDPRTHFLDYVIAAHTDLSTGPPAIVAAPIERSVRDRVARSHPTHGSYASFRALARLTDDEAPSPNFNWGKVEYVSFAADLFESDRPMAFDATVMPIVPGRLIWDAEELAPEKPAIVAPKKPKTVVKGGNVETVKRVKVVGAMDSFVTRQHV
jgi:hypothetical protein